MAAERPVAADEPVGDEHGGRRHGGVAGIAGADPCHAEGDGGIAEYFSEAAGVPDWTGVPNRHGRVATWGSCAVLVNQYHAFAAGKGPASKVGPVPDGLILERIA